ncbi:tetratricopeptide repeat protein [Maribacter flavus]|uniref:histidine kinase n=2 Tax=Maribacter flavus TaxID=1658664 RepID=A0A5B2TR84_9FLAO|nr:tetratricopeptide repeat protein [Maribacter flavus]
MKSSKMLKTTFLFLFISIAVYSQKIPSILKDTIYILELNKRAEELRYRKSDSIQIIALQALELSKEINYERGVLYSTYNLASYELYQGNSKKSLEINLRISNHPSLSKYPDLGIKIYNDIAQAHFIQSDHPKAFQNFLMANYLAEKTKNLNELVRINNNLGTMFLLLGDYNESMLYYDAARKVIDQETPVHIHGIILSNLGYLNMRKNNLDKAKDYLKQGLELAKKTNFSTIIAFNYLTTGEVFSLNKEYDKALEFYEKAEKEYQKSGDKKGISDLYFGFASVHYELGNYTLSKEFALKSLDLYKSFKLRSGLEKCSRILYKLAKYESDFEDSLKYLESAEAYSDSISKEQNKTNLSMLKAKLAFEEERTRLEETNLATINTQKKYIGWSLVSLILAIVVIFFIQKSSKKRKKLNTILADNERELHLTNQTKDKLFSIVGHDLRGPIISLKGLLDVSLNEENGESQFRRFGPKLQKDLEHIHFTLDNLLNWGQTQMKGSSMVPRNLLARNEVEDISKIFNENLKNKRIKLINSIPDNLCAKMDLNHFEIVFRNLISNAIKFSHEGGKILIDGEISKDKVLIKVKDNGVGISEDDIKKIWDYKEHLSTFGTNDEKGTGLGLMLCKEMVEKNNGDIWVESVINKGTTFKVSLRPCT